MHPDQKSVALQLYSIPSRPGQEVALKGADGSLSFFHVKFVKTGRKEKEEVGNMDIVSTPLRSY
jgi:hypothetical protein